jgi:hypothetical protein
MAIRLEVFTFPIVFNEVGDRRGPLNDSQIRQPNPHISGDLCIKQLDIVFMPITRNLLYHFEACLSFEESIFSGGSYFSWPGRILTGRGFWRVGGPVYSNPPSFHSPALLTNMLPVPTALCCRLPSLFKNANAR